MRSSLFDGATIDPELDDARLATQLDRVRGVLWPGQWVTLRVLARYAEGSEASVSARLRDLRKPRFGGYVVERRRVPNANGLHEYRFVIGPDGQPRRGVDDAA